MPGKSNYNSTDVELVVFFQRAKCFHCSRDLCLIHLTEHTQYVESQSRRFLSSYEQILNEFSNKLKSLSISSRIFELPFLQLEKWRRDAHHKLDQLAEQKRQEIQAKISEYQVEFTKRINEQKQKIEILIKRLNDLSRQTQIANKEIKSLEEKIMETKTFFSSIEKHSIKLSTSVFVVNIRTNFFDCPISTSSLPTQSRKARPELKESDKHRFNHKKRSLSASLL
jgi:chromosome segregation ATPase